MKRVAKKRVAERRVAEKRAAVSACFAVCQPRAFPVSRLP